MSNWERRHDDFPDPVATDSGEGFWTDEVASWLAGRKIPENSLNPGEARGTTFADRFLRNLESGTAERISRSASPVEAGLRVWSATENRLRDLLTAEERGQLLLTLVHRRACEPELWIRLVDEARKVERGRPATVLLAELRQLLDSAPDVAFSLLAQPAEAERPLADLVLAVDTALGEDAWRRDESGRSVAATVFNQVVDQWAASQGPRGNEFFTPRAVVRLAVRLVSPTAQAKRFYDPYCRAGEFLDEAVAHTTRSRGGTDDVHVYGANPNRSFLNVAAMNLALQGVDARLESLTPLELPAPSTDRFDHVFSNPPFNSHLHHDPDRDAYRWPYGSPPKRNANFAWLQVAATALNAGGRGAILMANNASLSVAERERSIRAAMVEDHVVECLVALPPQLFTSTGIPVTMWILKHPAERHDRILFVDATRAGTMTSRTLRSLSDGDVEEISELYRRWRAGQWGDDPVRSGAVVAASVPLAEVRRRGHLLHPATYVATSSASTPSDARLELPQLAAQLHRLLVAGDRADARVAALIGELSTWRA